MGDHCAGTDCRQLQTVRVGRYDGFMSGTPIRPGAEEELDEETERILDERLKTADEDAKNARDAYEFLAELRRKLRKKPAIPR
jgi:hypothetical protein